MHTIRLAIAEDHTILRQGLVKLLKEHIEIEIIAVANNGKELLKKIKGKEVDLVLLDEEMPEMDGRQTLSALNAYHPEIRVIFLTVRESLLNLKRLILNGARSVLSKSIDVQILVNAIKEVYYNDFFYYGILTPEFLSNVLEHPEIKCAVLEGDSLSKRELEIIYLICEGKSNGEMSLELSLSQRTIENHRQRISKKTGGKTTAQLVVFAIRHGIYEV